MKIRLAEILDMMVFDGRVVLKNDDGEVLLDDTYQQAKVSEYSSWFGIRVDFFQDECTIVVSEKECDYDLKTVMEEPELLPVGGPIPPLWKDSFNGPHLLEVTTSDDYFPVYELGIDVTEADLTEDELKLLEESREYLKQKKTSRRLNGYAVREGILRSCVIFPICRKQR